MSVGFGGWRQSFAVTAFVWSAEKRDGAVGGVLVLAHRLHDDYDLAYRYLVKGGRVVELLR